MQRVKSYLWKEIQLKKLHKQKIRTNSFHRCILIQAINLMLIQVGHLEVCLQKLRHLASTLQKPTLFLFFAVSDDVTIQKVFERVKEYAQLSKNVTQRMHPWIFSIVLTTEICVVSLHKWVSLVVHCLIIFAQIKAFCLVHFSRCYFYSNLSSTVKEWTMK